MLPIKQVVCISLLFAIVGANIIPKQKPKFTQTKAPQQTTDPTPPQGNECQPGKSLHSKNDIKVMIDHIYKVKDFDKKIKDGYQSKAEEIRDRHTKDLSEFISWFENKPVHLKHVLQTMAKLRNKEVEPVVKKVGAILSEYPSFEKLYNEKKDKANELENKLERYKNICHYNCPHIPITGKNITKRNAESDLYCNSLEELHSVILHKLTEFVEHANNDTNNELDRNDKIYQERIDQIKLKLKDEALNKFGRTMYDILMLQDEYHHFMEDIKFRDLELAPFIIKTLGLKIDTELLELEQVVEELGQFCNNCNSKTVVRNVRNTNLNSTRTLDVKSQNIVNELLDIKFKEIIKNVHSDWDKLFHVLNDKIHKSEVEKFDFRNLKHIQEQVNKMTKDELEVLKNLKKAAPRISIKKILELIRKLKELLKKIMEILGKLP